MRFYNFLVSKEFMIELDALYRKKYRLNQRVLFKVSLSICLLNVLRVLVICSNMSIMIVILINENSIQKKCSVLIEPV
jgi:hypothetical protein